MATLPSENLLPKMFCGECGGSYPVEDLVKFGNHFVCVNCKPGYVQRMREGAQPVSAGMVGVRYAGFWIRALALLIDGLIMGVINTPIYLALGLSATNMGAGNSPTAILGLIGLQYLISLAISLPYYVWFVSQRGGTLGKLALGLRVVTVDGRFPSVARSFGRYFALGLDALTLYIGFIIAGFDSEKRALHDHICSTRVIHK